MDWSVDKAWEAGGHNDVYNRTVDANQESDPSYEESYVTHRAGNPANDESDTWIYPVYTGSPPAKKQQQVWSHWHNGVIVSGTNYTSKVTSKADTRTVMGSWNPSWDLGGINPVTGTYSESFTEKLFVNGNTNSTPIKQYKISFSVTVRIMSPDNNSSVAPALSSHDAGGHPGTPPATLANDGNLSDLFMSFDVGGITTTSGATITTDWLDAGTVMDVTPSLPPLNSTLFKVIYSAPTVVNTRDKP